MGWSECKVVEFHTNISLQTDADGPSWLTKGILDIWQPEQFNPGSEDAGECWLRPVRRQSLVEKREVDFLSSSLSGVWPACSKLLFT
jgi:hypothetical protein